MSTAKPIEKKKENSFEKRGTFVGVNRNGLGTSEGDLCLFEVQIQFSKSENLLQK